MINVNIEQLFTPAININNNTTPMQFKNAILKNACNFKKICVRFQTKLHAFSKFRLTPWLTSLQVQILIMLQWPFINYLKQNDCFRILQYQDFYSMNSSRIWSGNQSRSRASKRSSAHRSRTPLSNSIHLSKTSLGFRMKISNYAQFPTSIFKLHWGGVKL